MEENLYDAVIVGGGVSGLAAAIYLARAKCRVLVIERDKFGGQITITEEVLNYPGILKTSGEALSREMYNQAKAFGSEFVADDAKRIEKDGKRFKVVCEKGEYNALSILVATGAKPAVIGFEGEEKFKGRGVAYCATCDGEFFTGKHIFVVGGGFVAAEESVFLTRFAKHVTVLVREEDFTCAKTVADKARENENITVLTDTVVTEVGGDNKARFIKYKNIKTGKETVFEDKDGIGVFVFAGYRPENALLKNVAKLNEQGYVVTDLKGQTSEAGIFASGDLCVKELRQVVTATADGALAATQMEKYVANIHLEENIPPLFKENEKKVEGNDNFSSMEDELRKLFERCEGKAVLEMHLDKSPLSDELESFLKKLCAVSDKIQLKKAEWRNEKYLPCVKILRESGEESGAEFHGVPSGHEFTGFVLAIYNATGEGQKIDGELLKKIKAIDKRVDIKILVSLSCTMCPEVVIACQRIATLNPNVRAGAYDVAHFAELKEKYDVMSVPCMVVNDKETFFGKKNIEAVAEILNTLCR